MKRLLSFGFNRALQYHECNTQSTNACKYFKYLKTPNAAITKRTMASKTKDALLVPYSEECALNDHKVSVVGVGNVGAAIAMNLIGTRTASHVVLVDANKDLIKAEMLDLNHTACFLGNPIIETSPDYEKTSDSKVVIITAGKGKTKKSRHELLGDNYKVFEKLIPKVLEYSPDAILLLVTNPVDVMTYAAWQISGLPKNRVLGTGTQLDSARFRYFVSQRLGVSPTSCDGWIIGEHGDSSVPIWSTFMVGGTLLSKLNPKIGQKGDPEKWNEIHDKVIKGAREIINGKGYTNWGVAMAAVSITSDILNNSNNVVAATVSAKGFHCIEEDIYLSLPCTVNSKGVSAIVKQDLSDTELELLKKSAEILKDLQDKAC